VSFNLDERDEQFQQGADKLMSQFSNLKLIVFHDEVGVGCLLLDQNPAIPPTVERKLPY
jgi:hypothetical protein